MTKETSTESYKHRNINLFEIEIETPRLILKSISMEYLDPIFDNFTESVTRYLMASSPQKKRETEAFIEDSLEKMKSGENLVVVILDRDNEEFIGCSGIHDIGKSNSPEMGIWIKESHHGCGYGKETMSALKRWAHDNLEYESLIYPVDRQNIASRKIAESLGGCIVREEIKITESGKQLDTLVYQIFNCS
ncbi:MAG: GNAT family N-acetyltransferase [Cyanobacteriota bacterium]|nr:GNAT family N-acetyltransferase [Cyanobacteriota bacterium]